jgi:hypothetical protein
MPKQPGRTAAGIVRPLKPGVPAANSEKRQKCPKCGEFMSGNQLKAHLRKEHPADDNQGPGGSYGSGDVNPQR